MFVFSDLITLTLFIGENKLKRKRKKEEGKLDLLFEEFNIERSMSQEWKVFNNEMKSMRRSKVKYETSGDSDGE